MEYGSQRKGLSNVPSRGHAEPYPMTSQSQVGVVTPQQTIPDVYSDMKSRGHTYLMSKQMGSHKRMGVSEERNESSFSYLPKIKGIARPLPGTSESSSRIRLPEYQRKQRFNLS